LAVHGYSSLRLEVNPDLIIQLETGWEWLPSSEFFAWDCYELGIPMQDTNISDVSAFRKIEWHGQHEVREAKCIVDRGRLIPLLQIRREPPELLLEGGRTLHYTFAIDFFHNLATGLL
jgi:hypothetical protein